MTSKCFPARLAVHALSLVLALAVCLAAEPKLGPRDRSKRPPAAEVGFKFAPSRLQITIAGKEFATYVFGHSKIPRPFFAFVNTPSGVQATRNFPPVEGVDDMDHDTYHPGIWLAFGDVSGSDYWRNKCKVEHELFSEDPQGGPGKGSFTVRNFYQDANGNRKILEICKYTILARPQYTLLIYDSTFSSDEEDFYFGDQEELGLGIRVNTKIAERHGGMVTNADGLKTAKTCWGQPSDWIDYSGVVDGITIGMMIMPSPKNFRPSWYHARAYGFVAANPFGRKAMGKGEEDKTWVRKGEKFHYGNGVAVYSAREGQKIDHQAIYREYLKALGVN